MNKQMWIVISLVIGVISSTSACATATESNLYVYGELGPASFTNAPSVSGTKRTGSSVFLSLGIGYQFNQHVAVELGYSKFADSELNFGGPMFTLKRRSLSVSAVGIYPLSPSFSVFGKIGNSSNRSELVVNTCPSPFACNGMSESKNTLAFGFGGLYKINDQLDIRLQWQDFGEFDSSSSPMKASALSVGAAYRF